MKRSATFQGVIGVIGVIWYPHSLAFRVKCLSGGGIFLIPFFVECLDYAWYMTEVPSFHVCLPPFE